jgi:hypothetical protein
MSWSAQYEQLMPNVATKAFALYRKAGCFSLQRGELINRLLFVRLKE